MVLRISCFFLLMTIMREMQRYRVFHMFENDLQLTFILTGLRYQSLLWI
jgi:hypothetical protein